MTLRLSRGQTFLPLVQKQWEILVPLRGQIVERATISVRDLADGTSAPKEVQTVSSNYHPANLRVHILTIPCDFIRHWPMHSWLSFCSKLIITHYKISWTYFWLSVPRPYMISTPKLCRRALEWRLSGSRSGVRPKGLCARPSRLDRACRNSLGERIGTQGRILV